MIILFPLVVCIGPYLVILPKFGDQIYNKQVDFESYLISTLDLY